jgi:hypothetical protein
MNPPKDRLLLFASSMAAASCFRFAKLTALISLNVCGPWPLF